MITKTNRFVGPIALRRFLPKASTIKMPMFSLKYLPTNRSNWRAGVVVSKKVHKSAVVRNRIRRRIFEILRKQSGKFISPHDMAFMVYDQSLAEIDAKTLEVRITDSLKKAKIMS